MNINNTILRSIYHHNSSAAQTAAMKLPNCEPRTCIEAVSPRWMLVSSKEQTMLKVLVGGFLIAHGWVTCSQARGSFTGSMGLENPSWLKWWPTTLGQSWLLRKRDSGMQFMLSVLLGLVWLASGVCLIGAGLGIFGLIVPFASWSSLAVAGAIISLLMLLVYIHPFYIAGFILTVGILYTQLVTHWPAALLGA